MRFASLLPTPGIEAWLLAIRDTMPRLKNLGRDNFALLLRAGTFRECEMFPHFEIEINIREPYSIYASLFFFFSAEILGIGETCRLFNILNLGNNRSTLFFCKSYGLFMCTSAFFYYIEARFFFFTMKETR